MIKLSFLDAHEKIDRQATDESFKRTAMLFTVFLFTDLLCDFGGAVPYEDFSTQEISCFV